MAFCSKCGASYEDGTKFCPSCGAKAEQTAQERPQPRQQAKPKQKGKQQIDIMGMLQGLNNTPDHTAKFGKSDINQNKMMAILSYIPSLVLIPIFAAPNSRFARFHANQGLLLLITEVLYWIAVAILSALLSLIYLGFIGVILRIVGYIVFIAAILMSIKNASSGLAKELPFIGKIRILK